MFEGREWRGCEGASAEAIAALRAVTPVPLPQSLLDLLAYSNGGEGELAVQPFWFVQYSAEEITQIERDGDFKEFFEDFFVFGGNGGGEAIAFDLRNGASPFPIVAFDMINIDLAESVLPVSTDFDAFLELVGREAA